MRLSILFLIALSLAAGSARAVILEAKADRNTKAPTGSLADSGWQWEGNWESFLGTTISKKYFITAGHIGGQVGDYFTLGRKKYKTIATYDDPNSDLQIWQIHGQFTSWAPLNKDPGEVGRNVVIFGRGTQRGDPVTVNNQLKGWLWGTQDGVESWGKNVITATGASPENSSNEIMGDQLVWSFDRNGMGQEGTLSGGDSGGGVFTKNGKVWRLVGINSTTESSFSLPGSSQVLSGSLVDVGGLMNGSSLITDTVADNPSHSYATRIGTESSWIYDVLGGLVSPSAGAVPAAGVPEPSMLALLSAGFFSGLSRRRGRGFFSRLDNHRHR